MQRVRIPPRGKNPSSVTQLPILTALHARIPTLFLLIIHDMAEKVNPQFCVPVWENAVKNAEEREGFDGNWADTPNYGNVTLEFVYFDEKTLKSNANLLAFCALLLYNNANLFQGGPNCG